MTPTTNPPIDSFQNFKGLWSYGNIGDTPKDHFVACQNCTFPGKNVSIRNGLNIFYTSNNHPIINFFSYSSSVKIVSGVGKLNILFMDDFGSIWDASTSPETLVHAFPGAGDFTAIELFGRVYISPKLNGLALNSEFTYYWDGTNFFKVAGVGPVGAVTLAQANPGIVDAGVHNVYVSFLYATGYVSPPSPLAAITSTGTNDIEVSNIPTGGANVVGRILLMTPANLTETFFVPGGTINDNVTTTATINIHDTALISSSDYLFNIMSSVPSVSHLGFYNGRVVYVGRNDFPFQVMMSDVNIFDSVNSVTGLINVPRDNISNAPNTGLVIRGVCYIIKPFGTYATQDNGDVPNTWQLVPIDSSLGGYDTGISVFSAGLSGSDIFDTSIVLNPRGILLFNGTYSDPPLSYKINDLWQSQFAPLFNNLKIAHDPINKNIYIMAVGGGGQYFLLVANYTDGLNYQNIKFSTWLFYTTIKPLSVNIFSGQDRTFQVAFCASDFNIYIPTGINHNYDGASINANFQQIITFAPSFTELGSLTCFNGLRIRIIGIGNIFLSATDENNNSLFASTQIYNLNDFTGSNFFGDLYIGINCTAEKALFQVIGDNASNFGTFTITRFDVFGIKRYSVRPARIPFIITNVSNSAGLIKITTGTANPFINGQKVNILYVNGTIEANGNNQVITVIDAHNFTINGSAFIHAYINGGMVYQN